MTTIFMCNGRKWQAPLLAPQELATVTPERFANLFFKLAMNNKPPGLNDIRMLLTQCFTSMLADRWHYCTQSAYTSRESVVQKWKDDNFWNHNSLAKYYATIVPSGMPSTPKGPSSVRYKDANRVPDRSSRPLPAPDLTKDWRRDSSQALSQRPRGREDRYLPSHRDSRSDSRRAASPSRNRSDALKDLRYSRLEDRVEVDNRRLASSNPLRSDAPKDLRYGRLEDRVEDPFHRIPPPKFTAEKTSGSTARGSTSTPFKRVKVEVGLLPPETCVYPCFRPLTVIAPEAVAPSDPTRTTYDQIASRAADDISSKRGI